jgi:hypothetical protein
MQSAGCRVPIETGVRKFPGSAQSYGTPGGVGVVNPGYFVRHSRIVTATVLVSQEHDWDSPTILFREQSSSSTSLVEVVAEVLAFYVVTGAFHG